jgi:hypothetical protein
MWRVSPVSRGRRRVRVGHPDVQARPSDPAPRLFVLIVGSPTGWPSVRVRARCFSIDSGARSSPTRAALARARAQALVGEGREGGRAVRLLSRALPTVGTKLRAPRSARPPTLSRPHKRGRGRQRRCLNPNADGVRNHLSESNAC